MVPSSPKPAECSPKSTEPQTNRRRSSSPAASGNQDEIEPPSQKRRRTSSPSPDSRNQQPWQITEEDKERYAALVRARVAESERRLNLGPMERLREDGEKLRSKILSHEDMLVTFEESRSARARCRAEDDCIYVQAGVPTGRAITTECRIRVDGVKDLMFWLPTTHYYHVACFNQMVDLLELIPAKFRLDHQTPWGILIRKWYEHHGHVDLNKLTTYIEAFKAYDEKKSEFSSELIKWSRGHQQCEADQAACGCPSKPQPPEKPILKDYTIEEEECSLRAVVTHPNFNDMCD
jgi:hypothetical protein